MRRLLILLLVLATTAVSVAQNQTDPPLDVATVQDRLTALESGGLDEATRTAAERFYNEALAFLARVEAANDRAAEFDRLAADAPDELARIRTQLDHPEEDSRPDVPSAPTLELLEQRLAGARADLNEAQRVAEEVNQTIDHWASRRIAIPEAASGARTRISELESTLTTSETSELEPDRARRTAFRAEIMALTAENHARERELASYEARGELLAARRDLAALTVQDAERLVPGWQDLVTARREADAAAAAEEARQHARDAARRHPSLKPFADATETLAASRSGENGLSSRLDRVSRTLSEVNADLKRIRDSHAALSRRLRTTGLSEATGLLLRREHESLTSAAEIRRQARLWQRELNDIEVRLIELDDERVLMGDVDARVGELTGTMDHEHEADRENHEATARELVIARRAILDEVIRESTRYFDDLVAVDAALREYGDFAAAYREFIDERVLWVRSVAGSAVLQLDDTREAAAWLIDRVAWREAISITWRDLRRRLPVVIAGLIAVFALWIAAPLAGRRLKEQADRVARISTDRMMVTWWAVLYTAIRVAPIPATCVLIGQALRFPPEQEAQALAVGNGLVFVSAVLVVLLSIWHLFHPSGVAIAHFRWPGTIGRQLRKHLIWFIPVFAPLRLIVEVMDHQDSQRWDDSLGRLAFMVSMVVMAVIVQRLTRPSGPIMEWVRNRTTWLARLRGVLPALMLLVPIVFLVLAWMGYYLSALELLSRLQQSILLLLILLVIHGTLTRWLFLARRRLAIEAARRRRELAKAEAECESTEVRPPVEDEKLDIPAMGDQTRHLFRSVISLSIVVGIIMIWMDVLPALRAFDQLQVWPSVKFVEAGAPALPGEIVEAASTERPSDPDAPGLMAGPMGSGMNATSEVAGELPILTAADLTLALVIVIVTIIVTRSLPSLIEIVLLQRLPLDIGTRYAIETVTRYIIVLIGGVLAFNALGIAWSQVQWLAAALTFGLAFGLQEIFANFISGLILLFERPVRVGDVVTVGDVFGQVSRIRMRATTIVTPDKLELIVPNKTFITDQVINWSLSDSAIRVIVQVGVSYDSDSKLVQRVLTKVVQDDPGILDHPAPSALFLGFGDSSLDFEVRFFVPHPDFLWTSQDVVRHNIHEALREAGIEIPYPQRDLHIRTDLTRSHGTGPTDG